MPAHAHEQALVAESKTATPAPARPTASRVRTWSLRPPPPPTAPPPPPAPLADLRASEPDDPLEREADDLADRVLRRSLATPGGAESPAVSSLPGRGTGVPLGREQLEFFEPRFGHSFADVRIHTDRPAMDSAQVLGAKAYTHGRDIVFGEGQYAPHTSVGQRLLAHELAHVVQQSSGAAPRSQLYRQTLERWWRGFSEGVAPNVMGGPGWNHDLGPGTYFTDRYTVAQDYVGMRAGTAPELGRITVIDLERAQLGRVLDLTKSPQWEAYIEKLSLGRAELRAYLLHSRNYFTTFSGFLKEQGLNLENYDAIIAPEGIRGGKQLCIRPTTHGNAVLNAIRRAWQFAFRGGARGGPGEATPRTPRPAVEPPGAAGAAAAEAPAAGAAAETVPAVRSVANPPTATPPTAVEPAPPTPRTSSPPRAPGTRSVAGKVFLLIAIGTAIYVILASDDKPAAAFRVAKEFAIVGLVYRLGGGIGVIAFSVLSMCSDNAEIQKECDRKEVVMNFLRERVPEAVKRRGIWPFYWYEPNPTTYQEAYDLLFNTTPVVREAPVQSSSPAPAAGVTPSPSAAPAPPAPPPTP